MKTKKQKYYVSYMHNQHVFCKGFYAKNPLELFQRLLKIVHKDDVSPKILYNLIGKYKVETKKDYLKLFDAYNCNSCDFPTLFISIFSTKGKIIYRF